MTVKIGLQTTPLQTIDGNVLLSLRSRFPPVLNTTPYLVHTHKRMGARCMSPQTISYYYPPDHNKNRQGLYSTSKWRTVGYIVHCVYCNSDSPYRITNSVVCESTGIDKQCSVQDMLILVYICRYTHTYISESHYKCYLRRSKKTTHLKYKPKLLKSAQKSFQHVL